MELIAKYDFHGDLRINVLFHSVMVEFQLSRRHIHMWLRLDMPVKVLDIQRIFLCFHL